MINPADIDLTELLTQWYGPPARDEIPLPDSCAWLPEPLQMWHRTARRWDVRILADHQMPPPETIEAGDDGKAVFMTDHTGDWHWAFSVNEPDSVVNGEPGGAWHPNPEPLAAFLGHMILKQIFFTGPVRMRANSVPEGPVAEIAAGLEPFDVSSWMWGELDDRILRGRDLLVELFRNGPEPGWYVQVAATRPEILTRLNTHVAMGPASSFTGRQLRRRGLVPSYGWGARPTVPSSLRHTMSRVTPSGRILARVPSQA